MLPVGDAPDINLVGIEAIFIRALAVHVAGNSDTPFDKFIPRPVLGRRLHAGFFQGSDVVGEEHDDLFVGHAPEVAAHGRRGVDCFNTIDKVVEVDPGGLHVLLLVDDQALVNGLDDRGVAGPEQIGRCTSGEVGLYTGHLIACLELHLNVSARNH